jgi:hypothetical protein
MKFRKLRIAWSVGWGILAVLLIALWVRSYWSHDIVSWSWNLKQGIRIDAVSGGASFMYFDWRSSGYTDLRPWGFTSLPQDEFQFFPISGEPDGDAGFLLQPLTDGYVAALPYWFLLLTCCTAGVIPWLKWRYRLRTLLIATTLLAVVLGLIVWAAR